MSGEPKRKLELTVFLENGRPKVRCVYLNDHRIAGPKQYVSENLPYASIEVPLDELLRALPFLEIRGASHD